MRDASGCNQSPLQFISWVPWLSISCQQIDNENVPLTLSLDIKASDLSCSQKSDVATTIFAFALTAFCASLIKLSRKDIVMIKYTAWAYLAAQSLIERWKGFESPNKLIQL